eukprot:1142896-Pelagomonas_calceolata.AAC.3
MEQPKQGCLLLAPAAAQLANALRDPPCLHLRTMLQKCSNLNKGVCSWHPQLLSAQMLCAVHLVFTCAHCCKNGET